MKRVTLYRYGEAIEGVKLRMSEALRVFVRIWEDRREGKVSPHINTYGLCSAMDYCFEEFDEDWDVMTALRACGLMQLWECWLGGAPAMSGQGRTARKRFEPRIYAALMLADWLETPAGRKHNHVRAVLIGNGAFKTSTSIVKEYLQ